MLSKILLPSVWWHFDGGNTIAHHRQKFKQVEFPTFKGFIKVD